MQLIVKTFDELRLEELYELLQLRSAVFVLEQECAYQDVDGKDQKAIHIIGIEKTKIVAYARVFGAGDYLDKASIGRVAVKENQRAFGYWKRNRNGVNRGY